MRRLFGTNRNSRGKRWREFPRRSREEERLDPSRSNGTCDLIVARSREVALLDPVIIFTRSYLISPFTINIYEQDFRFLVFDIYSSSNYISILFCTKGRNRLIFFTDRTENRFLFSDFILKGRFKTRGENWIRRRRCISTSIWIITCTTTCQIIQKLRGTQACTRVFARGRLVRACVRACATSRKPRRGSGQTRVRGGGDSRQQFYNCR